MFCSSSSRLVLLSLFAFLGLINADLVAGFNSSFQAALGDINVDVDTAVSFIYCNVTDMKARHTGIQVHLAIAKAAVAG